MWGYWKVTFTLCILPSMYLQNISIFQFLIRSNVTQFRLPFHAAFWPIRLLTRLPSCWLAENILSEFLLDTMSHVSEFTGVVKHSGILVKTPHSKMATIGNVLTKHNIVLFCIDCECNRQLGEQILNFMINKLKRHCGVTCYGFNYWVMWVGQMPDRF